MNKAILVLGDGTTIELEGKFILITETRGPRTLGVVDTFTCGNADSGGCVCESLSGALDHIRQTYGKRKGRSS